MEKAGKRILAHLFSDGFRPKRWFALMPKSQSSKMQRMTSEEKNRDDCFNSTTVLKNIYFNYKMLIIEAWTKESSFTEATMWSNPHPIIMKTRRLTMITGLVFIALRIWAWRKSGRTETPGQDSQTNIWLMSAVWRSSIYAINGNILFLIGSPFCFITAN